MIISKEKYTDEVIIFIHILKTAGETLNGIMYNQYKDDYIIKSPYWMQEPFINYLEKFDQEEIKKIKILRGHFYYGVHNYLPQNKYIYMTFLRNPIEQVVSFYYFTRARYPDVYDNISFYEYLADDKFNLTTSNIQTRFLSGSSTEQGNLETAKKNLENHFSIVGITERFDESLSVIKAKLGWNINFYDNRNVTKERPKLDEISDEIISIIKQKNKDDMKLYEFANILLDNDLYTVGNKH